METVDLRWQEHWKVIPLPIFRKPAYLDNRPYVSGIEAVSLDSFELDDQQQDVPRKHQADRVLLDSFSPEAFGRLIAKMAYGYGINRYGVDAFDVTYPLPAILGQSNDIGRWVGCDDKRYFTPKKNFFVTIGFKITSGNELIVRVKLFTMFDGAECLVIVGRMKDLVVGFLNSIGRSW